MSMVAQFTYCDFDMELTIGISILELELVFFMCNWNLYINITKSLMIGINTSYENKTIQLLFQII